MQIIGKPMWASVAAVGVVVAVLIAPVPYTHVVGYELTVAGPAGKRAIIRVPTRSAEKAERRAAELRRNGVAVTVAARTERIWGSVYAMAKDKLLLQISVDLDGKSDSEVADEIRHQLDEAGWSATDVKVQRGEGESTVEIGATDGAGHEVKIVRKANGGNEGHMNVDVGGIDDTREPGMTDAQLRDKIVKQLEARGMKPEVKVEGGRIEIRAERRQEVEEP